MTQAAINEQIEALKRVTEEAMQSKEAAIKFLVDAGIIKEEPKPHKNKGRIGQHIRPKIDKSNNNSISPTITNLPGVDNNKVIPSSPIIRKENSQSSLPKKK